MVAVKMGVVGAMMGVCARTCVAGSLEVYKKREGKRDETTTNHSI